MGTVNGNAWRPNDETMAVVGLHGVPGSVGGRRLRGWVPGRNRLRVHDSLDRGCGWYCVDRADIADYQDLGEFLSPGTGATTRLCGRRCRRLGEVMVGTELELVKGTTVDGAITLVRSRFVLRVERSGPDHGC